MEQKPPEAPDGSIFGKYLFAPVRKKEGVPEEPNTKKEDNLYTALDGHYNSSLRDMPLVQQVPDILKQVKAGNYKRFLGPPEGVVIYRGMRIDVAQIAPMLEKAGVPSLDDWYASENRYQPRKVSLVGKLTPKSEAGSPIQSWTTSPDVAVEFARVYAYNRNSPITGVVPVIFTAETSNKSNKLFGNPSLAVLLGHENESEGWKEYEVMSFGPVAITGFYLPGVIEEGRFSKRVGFEDSLKRLL